MTPLPASDAPPLPTAHGEWPVHQADMAASHYSPLEQIDSTNVDQLEIAWSWLTPDEQLKQDDPDLQKIARTYKNEMTPLMVDGTLYVVTSLGQIAALDPGTGETQWLHDPGTWDSGRPVNLGFLVRGLAYWSDGSSKRLLYATNDAYLISIDPDTGAPDLTFGEAGRVGLAENLDYPVPDRSRFLRA